MIVFLIALAAGVLILSVLSLQLLRGLARTKVELHDARLVCDLGNDPVLVADILTGRFLHANPAACHLLGYDQAALLERTLPDLHPSELRSKSAEVVADVWEKKGLTYDDLPFVSRSGELIDIEVSANVFEFRGQPAMLLYARDIRQRRRAEEKIRKYATELEATNRQLRETQAQLVQSEKMASLGNLVAGIAHEINNPVGSITANADVARRAIEIVRSTLTAEAVAKALPDDSKVNRALKILDDLNGATKLAGDRIAGIVKSLKNFARLDEAELKRVDLHDGIDSTLTLLEHEMKDRIRVVRTYGSIPEIACRANQLNQVFMNLIQNAIQAIPTQGTITITTLQEDGHAVLRFADTGTGIAPEHVSRVFDPGFTTKGVGVGTGLGLSICYRIVQGHKGSIDVSSKVGEGTTFTVRLPIR